MRTYVSTITHAGPNITESHQDSYQKHMSWAEPPQIPQINTEKNHNIMFSIKSAEKLMNNNGGGKMKSVSILFLQSCQQLASENQPRVTSISPLKERGDFAELLEITC